MDRILQLDGIVFRGNLSGSISGRDAFRGLSAMAATALDQFKAELAKRKDDIRGAAVGTVRGTGPGVSFGALVAALERDEPRVMHAPFENTASISGAVWESAGLINSDDRSALLKLRFEKGTDELPLHAHLASDRVIFVLGGRGFFHVSPEPIEAGSTRSVQSIAVRPRDALVFTRGVVHTFSAPTEPLELLSFHEPFIPLDEPDQYTVAEGTDLKELLRKQGPPMIACVPAWTLLVGS